jgi:2-polyprenyl-3-methyl-5-hydroxy-6-metoxy-1,4-benzoquinol methylase
MPEFDYDSIPTGYYDEVMEHGSALRRFWHRQKFERVRMTLPDRAESLLDIGCFAGTFLSLLSEDEFSRQVGVDILEKQVAYANEHYGTDFREFLYVEDLQELPDMIDPVDAVSLIEVIEHLHPPEIQGMLDVIWQVLEPGGRLVLTTPNYLSIWPALEFAINHLSDVTYEEQHFTKFIYPTIESKLADIWPEFPQKFDVVRKTTAHFVTPFVAQGAYEFARRASVSFHEKVDSFPMGSLIVLAAEKR